MAKEVKYIAKHMIPLLMKAGKDGDKAKGIAPVRPVTKNIMPGEPVMMDPEDANTKFFLKEGAIELAKTDAKVAAKAPASDESTGPKAAKDMTVDELKAELNEAEVEFEKDMKKADLVALVEKARADSEPLV